MLSGHRKCAGLAVKWGHGAQLRPAAVHRLSLSLSCASSCYCRTPVTSQFHSVTLPVQVITLAADLATAIAASAHFQFLPKSWEFSAALKVPFHLRSTALLRHGHNAQEQWKEGKVTSGILPHELLSYEEVVMHDEVVMIMMRSTTKFVLIEVHRALPT